MANSRTPRFSAQLQQQHLRHDDCQNGTVPTSNVTVQLCKACRPLFSLEEKGVPIKLSSNFFLLASRQTSHRWSWDCLARTTRTRTRMLGSRV